MPGAPSPIPVSVQLREIERKTQSPILSGLPTRYKILSEDFLIFNLEYGEVQVIVKNIEHISKNNVMIFGKVKSITKTKEVGHDIKIDDECSVNIDYKLSSGIFKPEYVTPYFKKKAEDEVVKGAFAAVVSFIIGIVIGFIIHWMFF